MIPPRMLSNENEIFGTGKGLRNRVTACRKRIRLNRFHRAQSNTEPDGRYRESAIGVSEFPGYLEDKPAVRGPLSEQEVGIT